MAAAGSARARHGRTASGARARRAAPRGLDGGAKARRQWRYEGKTRRRRRREAKTRRRRHEAQARRRGRGANATATSTQRRPPSRRFLQHPLDLGEDEPPPSWDPVLTPKVMVGKGSPKLNMIARGSPKLGRFLATTSATMKKKSPKCSRGKKAAGSPRVKQRASWNPALEKSLVHILLDYKDSHHRGENGWTSKGWNKMVKEFHEKNQARMQNGCKWNEKRCMIEGDDFMWNNLRVSFSRLKKFQNNKASFLLFDDLGLVYDGHLAEGTYNFTSMDNEEEVPLRQIYSLEDEMQELGGNQVHDLEDEDISLHRINEDVASEDASVERNRQPREASENASAERNGQPREASEDASVQRNVQQKRLAAALKNKEGKDGKKPKKTASIEGMMERYLEMRTKQAEEETASLEREKVIAQGADYSVKRCISVLSSMDVTKEEKAKAYAVFKNPENREVFLCACDHDLESALIWLRSEMV